ncbi:MAG: helix-turn-helix domain-containing protein [Ilumatobacter sp.]|uniref:helix-turn-helix domain-containing protein n=2 Tax=Ilumatobacter sp. TaxID=1967498 RepID=UPI00329A4D68
MLGALWLAEWGDLTLAFLRPVPLSTVSRLYIDMTITASPAAPLLDVNQVAERLCVNPRFVRRLIDERRIPFCKLGKFIRFDPGDIDLWVAEHRVEAVTR